MKKFISISLIVVGLFSTWIGIQYLQLHRSGRGSGEVIFDVTPGASPKSVILELQKQNLVEDAKALYLYARLTRKTRLIRVGEYSLNRAMSPIQILSTLASGHSIEHPFFVQEGFNLFEIADLWESRGFGRREEFLAAGTDREFIKTLLGEEHESLEGYLFPETYSLTKFTGARGLISMMVHRFLQVYNSIPKNDSIKLSRHQVAILASIVEKETGAPEERPKVSSVFHNRLRIGMRLQTDPTVLYGKMLDAGKASVNITKHDLLTPNKYNTYTIPGLPYGPIGNAGSEALRATLNPEQTTYLYFVSRNNGTHVFSSTYEQHQKAVGQFQLDRSAREGKSWRDLNKSKTSAVKK